MKYFFVLFLLLTPTACYASADIPADLRTPNREPGYCSWCSLETLGKHLGIKALYNLLDIRIKKNEIPETVYYRDIFGEWKYYTRIKYLGNSGGDPEGIKEQLKSLNVKFIESNIGSYDYRLVKTACDDGDGCVINVYDYPVDGAYHSMVITDLTEHSATFIDPNNIRKPLVTTRQWFEDHWDGFCVVLLHQRVTHTFRAAALPKIDISKHDIDNWQVILHNAGYDQRQTAAILRRTNYPFPH